MFRYRRGAERGVVGATALIACLLVLPLQGQAITFGTTDAVHTYVGAVVMTRGLWCSGSLVAPRVVLTAGHCVEPLFSQGISPNEVFVSFEVRPFDDQRSWRKVSAFILHPEYFVTIQGIVHDVGVLILSKPVRDIEPARLAEVGLLDTLAASGILRDATFTVVGYGVDENMVLPFERRMATSSFLNLLEAQLFLSVNPHRDDGGVCFGDSGGPALFHDGTSEVIVATSSFATGLCQAIAGEYRVDTANSQAFILDAIAANT